MSRVWERTNYRADLQFLIDGTIREFDITKANINILRDANVISQETYMYLSQCPKMERQIYVGKLEGSNSEVVRILKNGIANARRVFMEANGIQDHEVLAIRNDAIMVIGNRPITTLNISERVAFREAAKYTSFYHVNYLDFYYYCNRVDEVEILDIKGIKDKDNGALELHRHFMLEFLCTLFYCAQIEFLQDAITLLSCFHDNYINRRLPIEYYRELNSQSKYKLIPDMSTKWEYYLDYATEYDKFHNLDISYNEEILRKLNSMLASVYFATR